MYILLHNAFSIITVAKYNVIFVEKMMKFDSKMHWVNIVFVM